MKPKQLLICLLVAGAILGIRAVAMEMLVPDQDGPTTVVPISRAAELVKQGAVSKVTVAGDRVELEDRFGAVLTAHKEPGVSFSDTLQVYGATPEQIAALHVEVKPAAAPQEGLVLFGLGIAFIILIGLLVFGPKPSWALGKADATSFRRSTARRQEAGDGGVTFGDVAGAEEAKQELREVVDFLRNPSRFTSLGARVPRGVLLVGPPGTGKTLLARAVAGEAGVPFFSCSGSEFVEMYVGVGAARIRDLFQQAKKSRPCIVFIDEIDAVGRRRNAGGANEEREHSLNQILVEMDGFDKNANLVVMAATNRPDVLDPALLRPGRFDRRILVDGPDVKDRLAILKVHSRGKPLALDLDLEKVARQTTGFSGADLENLMNESALLAARCGHTVIGGADVEEAIDRVLIGLTRKSRVISEREKWITSYHEAGHALVAHELPHVDPVQRISIIPRGASGGHTKLMPMEDRHLWSRSQLSEAITFAMGGMVAEELVFGETTTGAASDLAEATGIARKMVCLFGMSETVGPISLGSADEPSLGRDLSEGTAGAADLETRRLLQRGREMAREILSANRNRLALLADQLFEQETLQGEELEALLERAGEETVLPAGRLARA